jgi:hypothetical protein
MVTQMLTQMRAIFGFVLAFTLLAVPQEPGGPAQTGATATSVYVPPTIGSGCINDAGSGDQQFVSCTGVTFTAGDWAVVFCRAGGNSATWNVTDGTNTYNAGPFNSSSSPTVSDAVFYALPMAAGTPTVSCNANSPQPFHDIIVVQIHPGSLSALDTAPAGNIVSGNNTWTSSAFTTTAANGGLSVACGDPNFGSGSTTAGLIGATTATIAQTSSNGPTCEYTIPTGPQSGITAAMSSGSSGNWGGTVLAFK